MKQLAEFGHISTGRTRHRGITVHAAALIIIALIALSWMGAAALGQASRPSGALVLVDAGGTEHVVPSASPLASSPSFVTQGIGVVRIPAGGGWLVCGLGTYHPQRTAYVGVKAIGIAGDTPLWWPDSRRSDGVTWSLVDDPGTRVYSHEPDVIPGSRDAWIVRGGDWIWLPETTAGLENHPELAGGFLALANSIVDLEYLAQPRLAGLLSLFGDRGSPAKATGAARDIAWTVHNWKARSGEVPARGWLAEFPRWGDGFVNGQYNELLWLAIRWAQDPTDRNWVFGLRAALAHACVGRVHTGPDRGRAQYEKGFVLPGDYFAPDWAKSWISGLAAWAYLSGHPVLLEALNEALDSIVVPTPRQVWSGSWGARIGANWLHDCVTASLLRPWDRRYIARMDQAVTDFLALRDPVNGRWINRGNGGTAPASPWMQAKLVHAMWRALERLHGGDALADPRAIEVLKAAKAVVDQGIYQFNGLPRCWYRFPPHPEQAQDSPALLGFMLPAIRILSRVDPSYGVLRREVEAFVRDQAGTTAGRSWTGKPPPAITEVGYEFHEGGIGGNPKAVKEWLMGALR